MECGACGQPCWQPSSLAVRLFTLIKQRIIDATVSNTLTCFAMADRKAPDALIERAGDVDNQEITGC
jgi:hypothetical protein